MPFRDAHHVTGAAVKRAERWVATCRPAAFGTAGLDPRITEGVYMVLTPEASVASRKSYGGAAPDQVRAQIKRVGRNCWHEPSLSSLSSPDGSRGPPCSAPAARWASWNGPVRCSARPPRPREAEKAPPPAAGSQPPVDTVTNRATSTRPGAGRAPRRSPAPIPTRSAPVRPRLPGPIRQPAVTMNHFELKGGELACEDVPLARSPRRSARRSMSILRRRWSGTSPSCVTRSPAGCASR
jgi:hypothetical protein